MAPLQNNHCQHLLKWRGVKRRDDSEALGVVQKEGRVRGFFHKRSFPITITPRSTGYPLAFCIEASVDLIMTNTRSPFFSFMSLTERVVIAILSVRTIIEGTV